MKIQVLFFAQLGDAAGERTRSVTAQEGITVREIVDRLFDDPQLYSLRELPLTYAVNEEVVSESHILCAEDTLALLPPVAGG